MNNVLNQKTIKGFWEEVESLGKVDDDYVVKIINYRTNSCLFRPNNDN